MVLDLDSLIIKLREEMKFWTSISLTVREEIKNSRKDSREPYYTSVRTSYIETALGQRRLEEMLLKNDAVVERTVYYCDGRRCARVFYTQGKDSKPWKIEINEHFASEIQIGGSSRPIPIWYLFPGKVPMPEALRKAKPLGNGRILDRDCDTFLMSSVKIAMVPQDLVYFLDRETGWPLRVEYYQVGSDHGPTFMNADWEVKDFQRISKDHYFPMNSLSRHFEHGNDHKSFSANTFYVESIQFNESFDSSEFWPNTKEPGVQIYDTIHKKITTVPGPDPREATRVEVPPKPTAPPASWGSYLAPTVAGLGLMLILVAVILRLRRS